MPCECQPLRKRKCERHSQPPVGVELTVGDHVTVALKNRMWDGWVKCARVDPPPPEEVLTEFIKDLRFGPKYGITPHDRYWRAGLHGLWRSDDERYAVACALAAHGANCSGVPSLGP